MLNNKIERWIKERDKVHARASASLGRIKSARKRQDGKDADKPAEKTAKEGLKNADKSSAIQFETMIEAQDKLLGMLTGVLKEATSFLSKHNETSDNAYVAPEHNEADGNTHTVTMEDLNNAKEKLVDAFKSKAEEQVRWTENKRKMKELIKKMEKNYGLSRYVVVVSYDFSEEGYAVLCDSYDDAVDYMTKDFTKEHLSDVNNNYEVTTATLDAVTGKAVLTTNYPIQGTGTTMWRILPIQ